MHFNEAVEKVNSTAVIRDRLTLLLEIDLTQSDMAPQQLNDIKSWLEEYPSERYRNNVKRMVLAALDDDLSIHVLCPALIKMCKPYWTIVFCLSISTRISTVHPGPIGQLFKVWTRG